jgi:hypothetical protein
MTLVASKKRFLEYLDKQIKDDEVIVLTNHLSGQVSASKKRNTKSVTFDFAGDAFSRPEDIGHIAFGKTPVLAVCICKREDIADKAFEQLEKAEK